MLQPLLLLPALLALASPVLSRAVPRAVPGFPNPLVDPFYSQPSNIASYALGDIIDRRATVSTFAGETLAQSYQLKFRSSDSLSRPIAAVTTVLVPTNKTLTSSGRASILSFQNFEDSASLSCSPSWAYVANSGSAAAGPANLEAPFVNGWALGQGYYVVIPDHQGPNSAFIAGQNAGRIVLDSIRAALKSESLGSGTQVGMYGYSGGANAAIFGSSLAPGYAPELNVVGVTSGGTPISPRDTFYFLNGGSFSGVAGVGALGLANMYPEVNDYLNSIITPEGNATLNELRADGTCVAQVATFPATNFFNLVEPPQDFLLAPEVQTALRSETLIQAEASYTVPVPKHPVFIYHALFDETVPFNVSNVYVREQCSRGANIRRTTYPLGGHITTQILGIPTALDFLGKAFTGTLQRVVCGTTIPRIELGSTTSRNILGAQGDAELQEERNEGTWQEVSELE